MLKQHPGEVDSDGKCLLCGVEVQGFSWEEHVVTKKHLKYCKTSKEVPPMKKKEALKFVQANEKESSPAGGRKGDNIFAPGDVPSSDDEVPAVKPAAKKLQDVYGKGFKIMESPTEAPETPPLRFPPHAQLKVSSANRAIKATVQAFLVSLSRFIYIEM